MTVDDLIFTFAEGHEDKLPYLVKRIDPGAVYALKRARAVAEFKAVRQNLCTLT